MTEKSFPWTDSVGDGGTYAHSALDDFFEKLFITDMAATEGVLYGDGNALSCAGAATPVVVQEGSAVVKGKFYINTADVNVAVATPGAGHTRKDRIVLQSDFVTMTIRIAKIDGVEDGDYPAVTQNDGTLWEIPLCKLSITDAGVITVVDERTFCHFGTMVQTAMLEDACVTAAKMGAKGRGAFVWFLPGTQAVDAKCDMEYVAPFAVTLTGGYIIAETAPTDAAFIMDVHSGAGAGVTVFTTQGNRPTLADGSTGPTAVVAPDVTAIAAGTRVFAAVDQIGATVAGANVTLVLAYTYALTD